MMSGPDPVEQLRIYSYREERHRRLDRSADDGQDRSHRPPNSPKPIPKGGLNRRGFPVIEKEHLLSPWIPAIFSGRGY
jgi:hypothetical protein